MGFLIFCSNILHLCDFYGLITNDRFSQTPQEARQLLKYLDPNLGEPLDEKDYGGNCAIYDRCCFNEG